MSQSTNKSSSTSITEPAVPPLAVQNGDSVTERIPGPSSGAAVSTPISAIIGATIPLAPAPLSKELIIIDENNKSPDNEDDRMLFNHVAVADVAVRTPIDTDNNNNNSDSKCQDKATMEQEKDSIEGAGKVATFSNNGSPAIGHVTPTTATQARRRVPIDEAVAEKHVLDDDIGGKGATKEQLSKEEVMVPLQKWTEMPRYLQFNPYVLTGYRPIQSVSGCLASLFYFHNETFNILTHGIPIVYILATVPSKLMWDDYRFLSWCHIVGAVAPWCGSFLYHLFMNVNRGETVYYTLLKLDMLGIWISQSFGALPMVTATVHCLNWPLKWLFIMMYSLLSIWGLYKAMCATSPWQRRLCFALPFTMRILLTMIRLTRFGGGNPTSMTHIFLQDAVSVVGGAIGAMHVPEKWFPGSMDFYLNSHNIMHVLVVLAVYSMHQATVQDLDWMSKAECLTGTTIQEASMTVS